MIKTGLIMLCAVRPMYGFVRDASLSNSVSRRLSESVIIIRLVKISGEDNDPVDVEYVIHRRKNAI